MSALLERGRAVLASQPFSVLLGTEVTAVAEDEVTLELALRDELKQQHGFAHGGVVSYLADNALTWVGATALGKSVVTVEMKINYLRPGVGERLIARASVLSATRNFAVTRCEVYVRRDGEDRLCAAAQATIAPLPPKAGA
jgi:uncharacterized protein (TIGR00369 family)